MRVFFIVGLLIAFLQANTFKVYTEELPPYNFLMEGKVAGTSTKILRDLMAKSGHKIEQDTVILASWARGYHEALNTKNTILYSMARTSERENLFKWVGPIDTLSVGLVAKKSSKVDIKSVECLHNYTIAVMHETAAESMLLNIGLKTEELERFSNVHAQLRKLQEGRVDAIAFGVESTYALLLELGLDPSEYETVYVLKKSDLYFAFHKSTDDTLIEVLNKTLRAIKK
ncbi:MAG: transporter substrate-binding domain-containing protein [Campylobacteraceae bacterium]|nr:transporter substrate-binding domain-containing protein [Campylobacteraceae bacterium]